MLESPVIHAAAISIRWQKLDDLPTTSFSSSSNSLDSDSLTPAPAAPSTTSDFGSIQTGSSSSASLSSGAKIGIGVGVGAGLVLVGVVLGLLYRLRRLKTSRKEEGEATGGGQKPDDDRPELAGEHRSALPPSEEQKRELITPYNRHEAEAAYVHEVHGIPQPSELPAAPHSR